MVYSKIQEGLFCRFCLCFADIEEIKKAGGSSEVQLVIKPFPVVCTFVKLLAASSEEFPSQKNFGESAGFPGFSHSTRCVERHDALVTFLQLLPAVKATLEDISNWLDKSCVSDCSAVLEFYDQNL